MTHFENDEREKPTIKNTLPIKDLVQILQKSNTLQMKET